VLPVGLDQPEPEVVDDGVAHKHNQSLKTDSDLYYDYQLISQSKAQNLMSLSHKHFSELDSNPHSLTIFLFCFIKRRGKITLSI
jgi:hypothetical protein